MLDWNDLRYFVAVAEQGSTLKAGRAPAREPDDGSPTSRRTGGIGWPDALRSTGRRLRADPRWRGAAPPRPPGRSGRRTVPDDCGVAWAGPQRRRAAYHPGDICGHLAGADAQGTARPASRDRDRARYRAGIARPWRRTGRHRAQKHFQDSPAGVVGRRLCVDDWTLYCSREYAAAHGVPRTRADLKKHCHHRRRRRQAMAPL